VKEYWPEFIGIARKKLTCPDDSHYCHEMKTET